MSEIWWILEAVGDKKFPYRLTIKKKNDTLLRLKAQDRWPVGKGNIFCLRDEGGIESLSGEESERIPVISLRRFGKRLSVVLDRPKYKRCEFLFLKKRYKTRDGEYEQIFWRTQQALKERKPKVKLTAQGNASLHLIIDINERYPWKLKGSKVTRERLPAGDYALKGGEGLLAVVERKTFENLLGDFGNLAILHQQLGELEAYEYAGMVIEASYSDFLNPTKLRFYSPTFAAKAIAELFALHPRLNIVFAGNRKLANEWVLRFFSAIQSHERETSPSMVREAVAAYNVQPPFQGGNYYEVRKRIEDMPPKFTISMLRGSCKDIPTTVMRRALADLKKEGRLISHPQGIKSYWEKVEKTSGLA